MKGSRGRRTGSTIYRFAFGLVAFLCLAAVPFRRSAGGCSPDFSRGLWESDGTNSFYTGSDTPTNATSTLFLNEHTGSTVNWNADRASTVVGFQQSAQSSLIDQQTVPGVSNENFLELDPTLAAMIGSGPFVSDGYFEIPRSTFPASDDSQHSMWRIYDHGACSALVPWLQLPPRSPSFPFQSPAPSVVQLATNKTIPAIRMKLSQPMVEGPHGEEA